MHRQVIAIGEAVASTEDSGLMTTRITAAERGSLDGSLMAPFNSYDNEDLLDYAIDIFYNLSVDHNLLNGNKRWAVVALLYFLQINGQWLKTDPYELYLLAKFVVENHDTPKDVSGVKNITKIYLQQFSVDDSQGTIAITPSLFAA